MKSLNHIFRKIFSLVINFFVFVIGFFILRDKRVWLFGAWMGEKFCDNARFLFQFVSKNKETYDVKRTIWVTRNQSVYETLSKMGYNVLMCGTLKSYYWHIKAGVHIVSNLGASSNGHKADIDGYLSTTAFKLQLWHGVGIKACSLLSNSNIKSNYSALKKVLLRFTSSSWFTPGRWENCHWVVTSKENGRALSLDFNIPKSNLIEGNYARNSDDFQVFDEEKAIVDKLVSFKQNGKLLSLYLPTFREGLSENINPIDSEKLKTTLTEKNIIWIEKHHQASAFEGIKSDHPNVLLLNPQYDVNTIFQYVDIVISDYSSVTSDAIIRDIATIDYVPDYTLYSTSDRGFVNDYDLYHPGIHVYDVEDLPHALTVIADGYYFTEERKEAYKNAKDLLFNNNPRDIDWLVKQIKKYI